MSHFLPNIIYNTPVSDIIAQYKNKSQLKEKGIVDQSQKSQPAQRCQNYRKQLRYER